MQGFGVFDFDISTDTFLLLEWAPDYAAAVTLRKDHCDYMEWDRETDLAIIPMHMAVHLPGIYADDMSAAIACYKKVA